MPTRYDVILATHRVVRAQLVAQRPAAKPWLDVNLGPDDGQGYNFSNRTLRPFLRDCIDQLKTDPVLIGEQARFGVPNRIPVEALLDGNVTNLERYIASAICKQLGL